MIEYFDPPEILPVLRHSFSNPQWWSFHRYLWWRHWLHGNLSEENNPGNLMYDPRMSWTLKDMRIEPPATRNPFKQSPLTEDQKSQRMQKGDSHG